ncbi:MAG: MFS transporter [Pseudomonadota bacterium]|nr:MAG: MFS transporter [Pseudomonadota bacterium]
MMLSATRYAVIGAGLIAVAYGLARFAFGLFVPPIRDSLGLSPSVMGLIGALPFVSFVLTSLFASAVVERLGARRAAMLAGGFAVAGLGLVSQSAGPGTLGAGVFLCGIATGMMMPALSLGNQAAVVPARQGRVNAIMNAGTGIGVAVSVPVTLLLTDAWRTAYMSFAVLAAAGVVVAWRWLPDNGRRAGETDQRPPLSREERRHLLRMSAFAAGMGFVSAVYWVFGPDMVVVLGGMPMTLTGWLWLVVGLVGVAGGIASELMDRFGAGCTQSAALIGLAVAMGLLMLAPGALPVALLSAGLFGFAYMTLTGVYLVSGIRLAPGRPALGAVVAFLAVAVGQALGSSLAGIVVDQIGYFNTFGGFVCACVVVAALFPWYPAVRQA